MFNVHCTTCDTTHLYGPRRIAGMTNTDEGIVVSFRCFCGGTASILTGRAAGAPVAAAPVDQAENRTVAMTVPATDAPVQRELVGCSSNVA